MRSTSAAWRSHDNYHQGTGIIPDGRQDALPFAHPAENTMLTKTKAYATEDGSVFTDKNEALRHGYALRVGAVADQLVELTGGTAETAPAVREFLLGNAGEIAKLLTRATAKPKPEAVEPESEPAPEAEAA